MRMTKIFIDYGMKMHKEQETHKMLRKIARREREDVDRRRETLCNVEGR